MLAKDLNYDWKTFKSLFKRRNGQLQCNYNHIELGHQAFKFNITDGEELLKINGNTFDQNSLLPSLMSAHSKRKFNTNSGGYPLTKYHWLEFAIRIGKFTYHDEADPGMAKLICNLLTRAQIQYKVILYTGGRLIVHVELICNKCHGVGQKKYKPLKHDIDQTVWRSCISCDGMRIDIHKQLSAIDGWEDFPLSME